MLVVAIKSSENGGAPARYKCAVAAWNNHILKGLSHVLSFTPNKLKLDKGRLEN